MAQVIINGRFVAEEQATVPLNDRGFRYGDGLFETIAVHNGVPYQYELHIARLDGGLNALKIKFDSAILKAHARELIKQEHIKEGMLRIQVTRGIGSKGYLPDSSNPQAGAFWVMQTAPLPAPVTDSTISLWQTSYTKPSAKALPVQFKLCQGLNSTLARMEASENNCFDALLSNEQRHVCETSSGNLFWVKDKILYTPSINCGVLDGTMRSAVLRLSPWRVQEVEATAGQLTRADAVFISNVAVKILPVHELRPQGIHWDSDKLTGELRALIDADIAAHSQLNAPDWA